MKTIIINKEIDIKWLTRELIAQNVRVDSVGGDLDFSYAEIHEDDEQLALTIIEAHNPETTLEALEKIDLITLKNQINNELSWITTTLSNIDTMTNVQVRDVVKRILQEQREELKAWRYVIRKMGS